jgi:FixJ family two-component response regulator
MTQSILSLVGLRFFHEFDTGRQTAILPSLDGRDQSRKTPTAVVDANCAQTTQMLDQLIALQRWICAALGISEGTVKTHLHHVFGKTGTTRQAELVKLIAGYSNALVV